MTYPLAAINEALALLPAKMTTRAALVQILTIGAQESLDYQHRRQMGNGPARGFWQFEQGGGVNGVMTHPATKALAGEICAKRGVSFDQPAVWAALELDDVLAAAFCRLLLWTDPSSLPPIGNAQSAWNLYNRVWRPGQPHPEAWPARYAAAVQATA